MLVHFDCGGPACILHRLALLPAAKARPSGFIGNPVFARKNKVGRQRIRKQSKRKRKNKVGRQRIRKQSKRKRKMRKKRQRGNLLR